jgi:hypothetical protein
MAPRLPRLSEELWHALLCHPTSSGRWDVGPRGADLAKDGPWHLVRVDSILLWWPVSGGESNPLKSREKACAEWVAR